MCLLAVLFGAEAKSNCRMYCSWIRMSGYITKIRQKKKKMSSRERSLYRERPWDEPGIRQMGGN